MAPPNKEGALVAAVPLDRVIVSTSAGGGAALLRDVAKEIEAGFTAEDAQRVAEEIARLPDEDDRLIEPIIRFRGDAVPLIIDVLRKASGGWEEVFSTVPALADAIELCARRLSDANVKRLRGEKAGDD